MKKLFDEYRVFLSYPWDMRVLLVTNLIYAFVMPVVEMFIGAYVMRKSDDVKMVVTYQLAVYAGIPLTFFINGWLLRHVRIQRLYSVGMLLSGVSMIVMMSLPELSVVGLAVAGGLMGMSFGLYWANRDFLALSSTNDSNRNYYYGLETFFATNTGIVVPLIIGAFIGWYSRNDASLAGQAYQVVTGIVFVLAIIASVVCHRGHFPNPPNTPFIFFRFHRLWRWQLVMAVLTGLTGGFIVTAPAMLVMKLVGKEGSLGTILSLGGALSAVALYIIGRTTKPEHRLHIFAVGLLLFLLGTIPNALWFNASGVLIFMICMVLARPLQSIANFTIQMLAIDTVSHIEGRNKNAYLCNQEFGFFVGRLLGLGLFLVLAYKVSDVFALRFALPIVAGLQLMVFWVARTILRGCAAEACEVPEIRPHGSISTGTQ
jgi:YQGE family putative transporter